jgi:hypothetical protein
MSSQSSLRVPVEISTVSTKYIIDETSEEYDANNNPIINPGNVRRGANHMAEGDTKETVAAKVKVQLTTASGK